MSTSGRPTLQRPARPGSPALSTSPLGPTPHGSPAPSLSLQPLGPLPWGSLRTKEVSLGTLWPACLGGFRPGPWTVGTICSHSLASWLSRCGRRRRLSLRHKGPQNRPTLRLPPSLSPPGNLAWSLDPSSSCLTSSFPQAPGLSGISWSLLEGSHDPLHVRLPDIC